jgi:hypothetical protein
MVVQTNDVEAEILRLDPSARARLAVRLIRSLDEEFPKEDVERIWLEEALERLRQLENGEVDGIPANEVFAEARRQLKS